MVNWGGARAVGGGGRGLGGARGGTEQHNNATLASEPCRCWRGLGRVWSCVTCARWARVVGEIEDRRAAFARHTP